MYILKNTWVWSICRNCKWVNWQDYYP